MPNIWTHLIFGQELLGSMGHQAVLADRQLKRVFNLGCQGPDFLFYHNFLPWNRDKKMTRLGSAMHQKECGRFLVNLIKQVQGRGLYNPAVVYVLGFITHHILDRNMHPYVFHKSGFKKWNHQRFEIIMDTLIVKRKLGLETWKTPIWKEIFVGKQLPSGVEPALSVTASRYYPELTAHLSPKDWNDAYRDMIRAQRLFHDPIGFKRILTAGQIAPLVYKRRVPPLDYLNEQQTVWNCPTVCSDTYTHSIWDLWNMAEEEGLQVLKEAVRILQAGHSAEDSDYDTLIELIGNNSYETGKPCSSELKIQHVNPMPL